MFRSSIEKRLSEVAGELAGLRRELSVIDEQLLHFADEADDARLRALVSETPLAEKEHKEAAKTVTALQRDRTVKVDRVARLEARQDELLDRLNEQRARR